jgi:hypothetical protein
MPNYLIERRMPGAGNLQPEQLRSISEASCRVLSQLGPQIQWVNSYVTADTVYCVYVAPDEHLIREHARTCGFPLSRITEIKALIDPATAE